MTAMAEAENAAPTLGEIIRRQRTLAEMPMRQFAAMVGISNPYLSQIERNLREPSDRVLQSIADHLHMSADVLTAEAQRSVSEELPQVVAAIRQDRDLTSTQRKTLEEMYETFREVTVAKRQRGAKAPNSDD